MPDPEAPLLPDAQLLLDAGAATTIATLLAKPKTDREASTQLGDLDRRIRGLILNEMAFKAPEKRVRTGTAFAFGADIGAAARIVPERRVWIFSTSFEQRVGMDGVDSYLSDRWNEAPHAALAFELLGLRPLADQLWRVLKELVGPLDTPATREQRGNFRIENVRRVLKLVPSRSLGDAAYVDWRLVRMRFALKNPRFFFQ